MVVLGGVGWCWVVLGGVGWCWYGGVEKSVSDV